MPHAHVCLFGETFDTGKLVSHWKTDGVRARICRAAGRGHSLSVARSVVSKLHGVHRHLGPARFRHRQVTVLAALVNMKIGTWAIPARTIVFDKTVAVARNWLQQELTVSGIG